MLTVFTLCNCAGYATQADAAAAATKLTVASVSAGITAAGAPCFKGDTVLTVAAVGLAL